jgi:hypothetical protein
MRSKTRAGPHDQEAKDFRRPDVIGDFRLRGCRKTMTDGNQISRNGFLISSGAKSNPCFDFAPGEV